MLRRSIALHKSKSSKLAIGAVQPSAAAAAVVKFASTSAAAASHSLARRFYPFAPYAANMSSAETSYCSELSSSPVKEARLPPGAVMSSSLINYIQTAHWSSSFEATQEEEPVVEVRSSQEVGPDGYGAPAPQAAPANAVLAAFDDSEIFSDDEPVEIQRREPSPPGPRSTQSPSPGRRQRSVATTATAPTAAAADAAVPPPIVASKYFSGQSAAPIEVPSSSPPRKEPQREEEALAAAAASKGVPYLSSFTSPVHKRPKHAAESARGSPRGSPHGSQHLAAAGPSLVPVPHVRALNQSRGYSTASHTIYLATQRQDTPSPGPDTDGDKGGAATGVAAAAPTAKLVKPLILSKEQEHILNLANYGTSLFYTGSAGTGKSVLLKSIIKSLKTKHDAGGVAITASTGLAACNIGGTTLHSFAGVGLGEVDVSKCLTRVKRNKNAYKRWLKVKVLIIDEVSMIDGHFLNKLNEIAKRIRRNKQPFGGIQLIVSGDFYQLPPVVKKPLHEELQGGSVGWRDDALKDETLFSFESEAWKETIQCTLILKEVFRQKGDQEFVDMLNQMRTGRVSKEYERKFQYLSRELSKNDGIEAAELFPTRAEVDYANNQRLAALPGKVEPYRSVDSGTLPEAQRTMALNNSLATNLLLLKKHAQVMCIKNFDETLVNGSLGQVVDFMDRQTYMVYNEMKVNKDLTAEQTEEIIQMAKMEEDKKKKKPAAAAAAVKDDFAAMDDAIRQAKPSARSAANEREAALESSVFKFLLDVPEPSSPSSSSSPSLESTFKSNKERKIELLSELVKSSREKKFPLVRFLLPDGFNTREVLVEPEEWTIEDESNAVLAKRVQIPLILAWSLSIHKSQGQTLPKVKVDLKKVFERGQAYVALSRATSRRGLQILNFRPDRVMVHEKVNRFYETLLTADELQREDTNQGPAAEATPIKIESSTRKDRITDYMTRI